MIRVDWSGPLTLDWLEPIRERIRRGIPVSIAEALMVIEDRGTR